MRVKEGKLGHLAPKGYRINRFNSVEIDGDLAYCKSHNFMYDAHEEERKLYDGLPCYYTDNRFRDTIHNYYKNSYLHWTRFKDISLKSCIRKVLSCKNIPVGTIIRFGKSWYFPKKRIDLGYQFKVKKFNKLDIDFQINYPEYFANFTSCEFSKQLTDALRQNGFIIRVENENRNFLSGMIATAAAYTGKEVEVTNEDGENAIAYGHGLKIGYSSKNNTFMGYSSGVNNILWDKFDEFNKWSQCNQIPKTSSIDEKDE